MDFEQDFLTDRSDESLLAEIRRVAELLGKTSLTRTEFNQHGKVSSSAIEKRFGTWNEALLRAGLEQSVRRDIPTEELFDDIERVWNELGRRPTYDEFSKLSRFSVRPLVDRFGGFMKALEAFIQHRNKSDAAPSAVSRPPTRSTHVPTGSRTRKRPSYGRLINFRGMQHAPLNELGVVFLFGMLAKELGFVVEAISAEFPDCEAKRLALSGDRWEKVAIEFEYKSSNFQKHGHATEDCDLIVCWEHDWEGSPIEVLALSTLVQEASEHSG